jgi:hypothetical protein
MTQPPDQPWLRCYGDAPRTIDCPRITLHEAGARTARRTLDAGARDCFATTRTSPALVEVRRALPKTRVGNVDFEAPMSEPAEPATEATA